MRILLFFAVTVLLHSCSAPMYTVMPQELQMIEETGDHIAGVSIGAPITGLTLTQIQGHYGYTLPYGLRVTADASAIYSSGFASNRSETASVFTYGLGVGYYRRLGDAFQWETNLKTRRLSGDYTLAPDSGADPFFRGSYGGWDTNLYTGIRIKIYKRFHIEFSYGYQWLGLERMDVELGAQRGAEVVADYRDMQNSGRSIFGINYVFELDEADLIIYGNYALRETVEPSLDRFNTTLVGIRLSKTFGGAKEEGQQSPLDNER